MAATNLIVTYEVASAIHTLLSKMTYTQASLSTEIGVVQSWKDTAFYDYIGENLTFDGTNYIDTGIPLFSPQNISRDFEVIINVASTSWTASQETIFAAMYEVSPWPGFVFRRNTTSNLFQIAAKSSVVTPAFASIVGHDFHIARINSHYYYWYDDNESSKVDFTSKVDATTFEQNAVVGAGMQSNGTAFRYWHGTLNYLAIKWKT